VRRTPSVVQRSQNMPASIRQRARARTNLSALVRCQAEAAASFYSITWEPSHAAPSTFHDLQVCVHRACSNWTAGVPVSDQFSDHTIFMSPQDNYAMRFWHDITHVRLDADFGIEGEASVAEAHLDVLASYGFGPESLEYQLLKADTLGQLWYNAATGTFPEDQSAFVHSVVEVGTAAAIERHRPIRHEHAAAREPGKAG